MTYPNILILDYLKRTGKATPEAQMTAEQYLNLGYQRLLTFEVRGGGFDWYGNAPANTVLTAYGLLILADMARVHPVDEALLDRTRSFLVNAQERSGAWSERSGAYTWSAVDGETAVTAYVAWALARAGGAEAAVERALAFLEPRLENADDPYLLALAANAFAHARPRAAVTRQLLDRLERLKTTEEGAAFWETGDRTLTYGWGDSALVETTALAAQAFLQANYRPETINQALTTLVRRRQDGGAWSTTQATVLALQALTAGAGDAGGGEGTLLVRVNGRDAAEIRIDETNADLMHQVELTPFLTGGRAVVELDAEGPLQPAYQLVARSYVPWRATPSPPERTVDLRVEYDRTTLRQNDILTARVSVGSRAAETLSMLIVDLGIAPGFAPERESLEALAREGIIERFEVTPRQVTLYMADLEPGEAFDFPVRLRARFPVEAKTPSSTLYEYYNPENRSVVPPRGVSVGL